MRVSRRSVIKGVAGAAAAYLTSVPGWVAPSHGPAGGYDFRALDARLTGDVLVPASPGFDAARRVFSDNPRFDRHPAAIARCRTDADVARCIEFARNNDLPLSVRAGGHDALAASVADGGLVVDLGAMNSVARGTGRSLVLGGGVLAGAVVEAAAKAGEVVATGHFAGVGITGLTLGGGMGVLAPSRGATCDSLIRARVVTADGRTLTASRRSNPDLFWALRGGGGNFGVVTELELATHRQPDVIGGLMVLDGARAGDYLRGFGDHMSTAPREVFAAALVTSAARRPVILLRLCYTGHPSRAERVLAPLRRGAPVLADGIRLVTFPQVMTPTPEVAPLLVPGEGEPPPWHQAPGFLWRGGSVRGISDGMIEVVEDAVRSAPPCGWGVGFAHHMHGALRDVGIGGSAMARPKDMWTFNFDSWWADPAHAEPGMAWVDAGWTATRRHAAPSYVNYLSTDDPAAVAAAYGPVLPRLRAIKRRYDPDNVFRANRNIVPA